MLTKIKNWFIKKWNELKGWFKRCWKEIISIAIVGTALAAGIGLQPNEIPFVIVNGEKIEFPYTDDNSGENLIIRTDKKIYGGWDGTDVYMMIENKSGEKQETKIKFLFSDKSKSLTEFYRLEKDIAYQIMVNDYATSTYDCGYYEYTNGSTTNTWIDKTCEKQEIIGTHQEIKYRDEWQQLTDIDNEAEFAFPTDKIAYFKTRIQFPRQTKDEFIIEIAGDKQGWGRLK